jgi:hypothetical protein
MDAVTESIHDKPTMCIGSTAPLFGVGGCGVFLATMGGAEDSADLVFKENAIALAGMPRCHIFGRYRSPACFIDVE